MRQRFTITCTLIFIGIICITLTTAESNQPGDLSTSIGGTVPLEGSMPGADMVYLALTSSKLPPNGVRLDNIKQKVQTGNPSTFTQVPVTAGTWQFNWNTGDVSGALPEGRYIVYVCDSPVGKDDYSSQVRYETREIELLYRGYQDTTITTPVSRETPPPVTSVIPTTSHLPAPTLATTVPAGTEQATSPATRASSVPVPLVFAALLGTGMFIVISRRRI